MKEGPNIAQIAALIGDPARANMLMALMSGKALTATELAAEAGVTIQTASSHLAKLEQGTLIGQNKQGRHRYFSIADPEIAELLERMTGLAERRGLQRTRTGPKDPVLRKARVCYDHLAGELAVKLFERLIAERKLKLGEDGEPTLSSPGKRFFSEFGVDVTSLEKSRRPICRSCLDWSVRRNHLAGGLGAALLNRFFELNWAIREKDSRAIVFSPSGERELKRAFRLS